MYFAVFIIRLILVRKVAGEGRLVSGGGHCSAEVGPGVVSVGLSLRGVGLPMRPAGPAVGIPSSTQDQELFDDGGTSPLYIFYVATTS